VNPPSGLESLPPGPSPDENPGEDEDAWVPPDELRHLDGQDRLVSTTAKVFPHGCYLEPDSISQTVDKLTGQPVYQCKVVDPNPALKGRPHDTVVYILTDQKPSPPTGLAFEPVEFDQLTITPYVTDSIPPRIAYALRATGIRPAGGAAATAGEHVQAMELMTVADGRPD